MKQMSLATSGLSLSQAQSVSNLCNQRASEIGIKLNNVNNYSKKVNVDDKTHIIEPAKPLPENALDLLIEKSKLHACQAFLMENIRAKSELLDLAKSGEPNLRHLLIPKKPDYVIAGVLFEVGEDFGWDKLTISENSEYLEAEAYAAHIGQFIHKGSTLSNLRLELPNLPAIEWMNIYDGVKSPIEIITHHTSEDLLNLHEKLAKVHREYEQKVNYFKAKIKNLTTAENARIAKINADAETEAEKTNNELRTQYDLAMKESRAEVRSIRLEFEKDRQGTIKNIAKLRIDVSPRFQEVIDQFLTESKK